MHHRCGQGSRRENRLESSFYSSASMPRKLQQERSKGRFERGKGSPTVAGVETPAAGTTPANGLPVSLIQSTAPATAAVMLSVSRTLHSKNLATPLGRFETNSAPFSAFKSNIATWPPFLHISSTQAWPSPDALRSQLAVG